MPSVIVINMSEIQTCTAENWGLIIQITAEFAASTLNGERGLQTYFSTTLPECIPFVKINPLLFGLANCSSLTAGFEFTDSCHAQLDRTLEINSSC